MRNLKGVISLILLAALALAPACASTEVQEEADRRAQSIQEDNENLRKQLTDLSSVETALNKEIGRKDEEISRLRGRNAQLERENGELRNRPAEVREPAPSTTDPIAVGPVGDRNVEVVNRSDGSVILRIAGAVMFASGRDTLTEKGSSILDKVAQVLRRNPDALISVEGHTDAEPLKKTKEIWGTNLALSLARAMSVQDYLKRVKKIPEKRMRVVGYGEHRPISKSGRAAHDRNRRVELVLYRGD